jgi:hypothetical protein
VHRLQCLTKAANKNLLGELGINDCPFLISSIY